MIKFTDIDTAQFQTLLAEQTSKEIVAEDWPQLLSLSRLIVCKVDSVTTCVIGMIQTNLVPHRNYVWFLPLHNFTTIHARSISKALRHYKNNSTFWAAIDPADTKAFRFAHWLGFQETSRTDTEIFMEYNHG